MKTSKSITEAVNRFISLIKLGWETELAFNCQYDTVCDEIGENDFLNLCQTATIEQSQIIYN